MVIFSFSYTQPGTPQKFLAGEAKLRKDTFLVKKALSKRQILANIADDFTKNFAKTK